MTTRSVGIVGAGVMGVGIAQVVLEAGDRVVLHDVDPGSLERAHDLLGAGLLRRATSAGLTGAAARAWVGDHLARLETATTVEALGAAGPDLVIEAALEDLDTKRAIFAALEAVVAAGTILATNTSALRVRDIAAATLRPERVLGLHWFNPAPLMALVEVVATEQTAPTVVERAIEAILAWGRTPVRSADTPGFIVNRVNRPFTIEALRLLEAGDASVEEIDLAMRAAGFPMGPFELMDLAGLDVNLAAARGVWEGLGRPDRFRPSQIQGRLVASGRLGRKSGEGFYGYDDTGRRGDPAREFARAEPTAPGANGAAIVARITAAIDAEAERAASERVASRDDIALALRLGAGHPLRSTP